MIDLALFKICRGNEANLPSQKTDGYAYFCTDTGNFFIDWADSDGAITRTKINADSATRLRYQNGDEYVDLDAATIDSLLDSLYTEIANKQPKGSYAVTNAGNTFDGEQKMFNASYCPTMNDIAPGIGCSLKNSRACDNQLIVGEIWAPTTAVTDDKINMTTTAGEIPFYSGGGASAGQFSGKTLLAKITAHGVYAGDSVQAAGTSLLRNSKLVSAETTPAVNGEICWTYE